jgi:CRP-like cAMP-binding protein
MAKPASTLRLRAPAAPELEALRAGLARLGVTGREAEPFTTAADAPTHTLLLEAGQPADRAGLVLRGVVREYYLSDDGVERTRGFALPGDFFGSLSDALTARPARVFVRTESPSTLLLFPWERLRALAAASLPWERLLAQVVERLYLRKAQREFELLALDAMGRYQSLLAQHPGLEAVVPGQLIASYLGITGVHLSRLRRRLGTARPRRKRR